jgi:ribosomal protein S18 acetylase RimI-like enzyme
VVDALLLIRPPGPVLATSDVGAQPIDRSALDGLAEAYWRSYADVSPGFPLDDARQDITHYFDGGYGPPAPDGSWLVRRAGTVVGAVLTVREALSSDLPPSPFVIDLFVVPEERRRGIGSGLMAAALSSVGSEAVGLRVEPDNIAARELYAALGFEVAPRR